VRVSSRPVASFERLTVPNVVDPVLLIVRIRFEPLFVRVPFKVKLFVPPILAFPVVTAESVMLLEKVRGAVEAKIVGVFALVPPSVKPLVPKAELFPMAIVPLIIVVPPV
jgi:hypothetical protein